jgi:hypothetical protein
MGNYKYFASHDRGDVMVLGTDSNGNQLDSLFFSDKKGSDENPMFVGTVDMDKPDGQERVDAIMKSKRYQKGFVVYVPSPDELDEKLKAEAAAKKKAYFKEALEAGTFTLNPDMDYLKLKAEAESIGIKDGLGAPKPVLFKKFCEALGVEPVAKPKPEPQAVIAKPEKPLKKKGNK